MRYLKTVPRAALILGLLASSPLVAQQYTVTLLPSPTNETYTPIGAAVNAAGKVTGFLGNGTAPVDEVVGNFETTFPGQPTAVSMFTYTTAGGTKDLGSYDPDIGEGALYCGNTVSPSIATGINKSGQITGTVCADEIASQALFYANKTFTPIPALIPGTGTGFLQTWGSGINSAGTIVGTALLSSDDTCGNIYHAYTYITTTATLQDLGTFTGCSTFGLAINDSGDVAGVMWDSSNASHAFLYSNSTQQMTDLGNLGTQNAAALAINATDEVTGYSYGAPEDRPEAFLYSGGQMHALSTGALSEGFGGSQGNAINASGKIVGQFFIADDSMTHAFVYRNGAIQDLNSLIPASDASTYTLYNAVAINDGGEIVALGYLNSNPTYAMTLLLEPIADAAPTITPQVTGTQGTNGWYTGDVTLGWSIVSAAPIVSKTGCATKTLVANTKGTVETCTVTTAAGPTSASVTIQIDKNPPTTKAKVTPVANAAGWNHAAVTVTFVGTDAISGISSCSTAVILSAEGVGQSASGSCTNNAGLASGATALGINIDLTPPTVSIVTPANGATYALGSTVLASYTCADSLSGVKGCAGTVASGAAIATGTKGARVFTVTATDNAGNVTKTQYSYTVQ